MPYQRRADGRIAVTIDSNVWNLLHELNLALTIELPSARFALFVPREVEIELTAIPGDKIALKRYVRRQLLEATVKVSAVFGFAAETAPQRRGGFGFGTFQSEDARAFYAAIRDQYLIGKSLRNSRLYHNEADAALGAAALSSVVLTCDTRKAGPLRVASEFGGKLVDMTRFDNQGQSLASLIEACHSAQ